jgi:2-polyprenyl-3-methyl-5-hydroxy-6-metoxy-1,4-benzoquinol methylase
MSELNKTSDNLKQLYSVESRYFGCSRSEMLKYLPPKFDRMLDVGCSNGAFGEVIKKSHACEVWGVDINSSAIELAKEKLDQALCCDLTTNLDTLEDDKFDVIYFNDVLEHFIDPYSLLSGIKSKLTQNGQIIASIPNVRYFRVLSSLLMKRDWKYEDDGVMDRTHLRFFTKKSICRMFEEAGYKVNIIEPINKTKSLRPYLMSILTLGLLGRDIFYPQFAISVFKDK